MPTTTGTRTRGKGGRFASSKGMFSTNTLERGLAQFEIKMLDGIEEFAAEFADELVRYAKEHAPWNNRTWDARNGLSSSVEKGLRNESITVTLFHTVYYGIYLEVRWGGRYAIIIPTIEQKGPELFRKMEHMMDGIIFYD